MKGKSCILVFLISLSSSLFCWAWSYPVQEVEGSFCWETGGKCTLELPRILNGDLLQYYQIPRYRQIYSVLWGGTYFGGWDFGFGSHQGIDIASTKWTPIYAASEGRVIIAQEKGDRWKVIVIQHSWQGKNIYTVYAHLESIGVDVGELVVEGQKIAEMGSTGNSTGPHLHFQIDINEGEHPYFPKGCGGTISEVVNEGKCRNEIKKNTLDPILFLETQGKLFLTEQQKEYELPSIFVSPFAVDFKLKNSILMLGTSTQMELIATSQDMNNFLSEELHFISPTLDIFPKQLSYLGSGRSIIIMPKTVGLHYIDIHSRSRKIKRVSIFVLDEQLKAQLEEKVKASADLQTIVDWLY